MRNTTSSHTRIIQDQLVALICLLIGSKFCSSQVIRSGFVTFLLIGFVYMVSASGGKVVYHFHTYNLNDFIVPVYLLLPQHWLCLGFIPYVFKCLIGMLLIFDCCCIFATMRVRFSSWQVTVLQKNMVLMHLRRKERIILFLALVCVAPILDFTKYQMYISYCLMTNIMQRY